MKKKHWPSHLRRIICRQKAQIEQLQAMVAELRSELAVRPADPEATGRQLVAYRHAGDNALTVERMRVIAQRHGEGRDLSSIVAEMGCSKSAISRFLTGTYSSGAARTYYSKHGVPKPTPDFNSAAQAETD